MNTTQTITIPVDVKFLVHPEQKDLFAYFPATKNCYASDGGHSNCSQVYMLECRKASKQERAALIRELESIGYTLNILN